MSEGCNDCADLRARLMMLRAEVAGTASWIRTELDEPTMPWKQLVPTIAVRLDSAAAGA